uniref:Zinc-ribbon domain protein n=1 Tax=Siphoviridae sp. ctVCm11 TaxID=2826358 RepID=A0A8S5QLM1_9CAUD|nr:MAG TPA: zinc-ribbon domain protein [Siphoviridae sp. ctVCm11]
MAKYIKDETMLALIRPDDPNDERCAVTVATAKRLIRHAVTAAPAADVVPVVHGRWIRPHWKNSNYCCDCSECGGEAMHRDYQWDKNGIYPICPNCGAKMDGGAGNEAD